MMEGIISTVLKILPRRGHENSPQKPIKQRLVTDAPTREVQATVDAKKRMEEKRRDFIGGFFDGH